MAAALLLAALTGCASAPAPVETGGGQMQAFAEYSYEKNSVLFSTAARDPDRTTVFLDTIYPFDLPLRYQHAEPLVRFSLAHPTQTEGGALMVALDDLARLYAPHLRYTVEPLTGKIEVQHRFLDRKVTAGMGTRSPTVRYTARAHTSQLALGVASVVSQETLYEGVTRFADLATAPVANRKPSTTMPLETAPVTSGGRVYVPVASFMRSLGKTASNDAARQWLAISDVDPADTTHDLFNPAFTGTFSLTPLTASRMQHMRGVLDGTLRHGNFWHGFYLGDVAAPTGTRDASGSEVTATHSIHRILPYRVFLPRSHDPRAPGKFVLMLHGATGNENAPVERFNDHLKHQPTPLPGVVTVEDFADRYGYILMLPNGWTRNPQWHRGPGEASLRSALEDVQRRVAIDPQRMFIAGNSAGGSGAMNVVLRSPGRYRALAPTAMAPNRPNGTDLTGAILDLPTLMACFSADVTIYYHGAPNFACQPWLASQVQGRMRQLTFVTVENGHHSYGPGSLLQMTFEFFDRVLAQQPLQDTGTVQLRTGERTARITAGPRAGQVIALGTAPVQREGVVMVTLSDLARIYGASDFLVYDVHAYNQRRADLVSVKTVLHNLRSLNLRPGSNFMRVGGSLKPGDTSGASTRVAANDPGVDPRALPVATVEEAREIWVPAVATMQALGRVLVAD
jgi:predicted esterase